MEYAPRVEEQVYMVGYDQYKHSEISYGSVLLPANLEHRFFKQLSSQTKERYVDNVNQMDFQALRAAIECVTEFRGRACPWCDDPILNGGRHAPGQLDARRERCRFHPACVPTEVECECGVVGRVGDVCACGSTIRDECPDCGAPTTDTVARRASVLELSIAVFLNKLLDENGRGGSV